MPFRISYPEFATSTQHLSAPLSIFNVSANVRFLLPPPPCFPTRSEAQTDLIPSTLKGFDHGIKKKKLERQLEMQPLKVSAIKDQLNLESHIRFKHADLFPAEVSVMLSHPIAAGWSELPGVMACNIIIPHGLMAASAPPFISSPSESSGDRLRAFSFSGSQTDGGEEGWTVEGEV